MSCSFTETKPDWTHLQTTGHRSSEPSRCLRLRIRFLRPPTPTVRSEGEFRNLCKPEGAERGGAKRESPSPLPCVCETEISLTWNRCPNVRAKELATAFRRQSACDKALCEISLMALSSTSRFLLTTSRLGRSALSNASGERIGIEVSILDSPVCLALPDRVPQMI